LSRTQLRTKRIKLGLYLPEQSEQASGLLTARSWFDEHSVEVGEILSRERKLYSHLGQIVHGGVPRASLLSNSRKTL